MAACVAHDGSITGEHGVGWKKAFLTADVQPLIEMAAMQDIKEVFDPDDPLNPRNIFPEG